MTRVGAFEAKTHLSALLLQVQNGESIEITKRGIPIAVISPITNQKRSNATQAAEIIRSIGKRNKLNGLSIREMIDEGRRY